MTRDRLLRISRLLSQAEAEALPLGDQRAQGILLAISTAQGSVAKQLDRTERKASR